MIRADLRTKRFLPRASNGNILLRRRLKQIVYLSTWKYCRAFPGQIASFRSLVKTVLISFRPSLVRYSTPCHTEGVQSWCKRTVHSGYRTFQNAQIIFREQITWRSPIDFSILEKPWIFGYIHCGKLKQICIIHSLCNQPFAINLALIANVRHNPRIISSKKIMQTNNHLDRNNPTAQAIFLIIKISSIILITIRDII